MLPSKLKDGNEAIAPAIIMATKVRSAAARARQRTAVAESHADVRHAAPMAAVGVRSAAEKPRPMTLTKSPPLAAAFTGSTKDTTGAGEQITSVTEGVRKEGGHRCFYKDKRISGYGVRKEVKVL